MRSLLVSGHKALCCPCHLHHNLHQLKKQNLLSDSAFYTSGHMSLAVGECLVRLESAAQVLHHHRMDSPSQLRSDHEMSQHT